MKVFTQFTKTKKITGFGLVFFLITALASQQLIPPLAKAERLESNSYIIQFGNFNSAAHNYFGDQTTTYNLNFTLGQSGAGPYGDFDDEQPDSSTYFVGGGFQYIYQIGQFEFSISDLDLDFGSMTPGVHAQVTNDLTISTRGAGGYTVYAYENQPMTHFNGTDQIPDTTCDDDNPLPCDETEAKEWTDENEPGFGFNAQGDTVSDDFKSTDDDCSSNTVCFRQFANRSQPTPEPMQAVMSSVNIAADETATITYQLGIDGTQAAGLYETSIVYVAVPGY